MGGRCACGTAGHPPVRAGFNFLARSSFRRGDREAGPKSERVVKANLGGKSAQDQQIRRRRIKNRVWRGASKGEDEKDEVEEDESHG